MRQVGMTRADDFTFEFIPPNGGVRETVSIRFVDGKFDRCHYPFSGLHSFEEWMILGQIAEKIKELQAQYDKE